jgi:DNA-binding GntR family transcriptional regulator
MSLRFASRRGSLCRLAAQRASAADIAGLSRLQAQVAQAVRAGDLDPILPLNQQFHLAIDHEDVQ